MTEKRVADVIDFDNFFFKGKPFVNIMIASLIGGLTFGLFGFFGDLTGFLVTAAILTGVSLLGFSISYLSKRRHTNAHLPEQGNTPRIARGVSLEHYQEPEPERKNGMELMERGNKAAALGRKR